MQPGLGSRRASLPSEPSSLCFTQTYGRQRALSHLLGKAGPAAAPLGSHRSVTQVTRTTDVRTGQGRVQAGDSGGTPTLAPAESGQAPAYLKWTVAFWNQREPDNRVNSDLSVALPVAQTRRSPP